MEPAAADLVLCLDYPRLVSLGRLVRRSIRRVVTAEPVCNGNVETWSRLFAAHGPTKVVRFRTHAEHGGGFSWLKHRTASPREFRGMRPTDAGVLI